MGKYLSNEMKERIVEAFNQNLSQKQIAMAFGVKKYTVPRVLKRNRELGDVSTKLKQGRPRKTSERIDKLIARKAKINPKQTAVSINRELREYNSKQLK